MVSAGSSQTFTWRLNLTDQEKLKQLKVQFGSWDKDFDVAAGIYLMTFFQEPSANGSVVKTNHSIVKRLQWVGDLTRDYFVAFKLFDVKLSDSGDYGIRFRVDLFPAVSLESWFTLSVQVRAHYSPNLLIAECRAKMKLLGICTKNWGLSHDVTKNQTRKLLILQRLYFHDVYEQLKTSIHTHFRSQWVLGFVIDYA